MRITLGFIGTIGVVLTITGAVLALIAIATVVAGGHPTTPGLFLLAAISGSPGLFLWRMGVDRKRRLRAVLQHAELIQSTGVSSLAALAAQVGYSPQEAAWCVKSALERGLLPGKRLDLVHGMVFDVPQPVPQPIPQVVALAPPVPPPLAAAQAAPPVSTDTSLSFLYDDHEEEQEFDEEAPAGEEASTLADPVLIEHRLRQHRKLVHRRQCAHCEYSGRMGVSREIDYSHRRMAGRAIKGLMGHSGMARWMTSDLRKQKNQWEANCPNCGGINYFDVY
jgi:hypothetical protein